MNAIPTIATSNVMDFIIGLLSIVQIPIQLK